MFVGVERLLRCLGPFVVLLGVPVGVGRTGTTKTSGKFRRLRVMYRFLAHCDFGPRVFPRLDDRLYVRSPTSSALVVNSWVGREGEGRDLRKT